MLAAAGGASAQMRAFEYDLTKPDPAVYDTDIPASAWPSTATRALPAR